MGIGLKETSWTAVVQRIREEDLNAIKKGFPSRLRPEKFEGNNNIKTTTAALEWFANYTTKYNEKGNALPSTLRGKRRNEKK